MKGFKVWLLVIIGILLSSIVLNGCGGYKLTSTPTGVTATPGNGQATITWSAVSHAKSYNIYWSTISGVTPANGAKIAGATSPYIHTGLTNGTTYYYVVTEIDPYKNESERSTQVSCTPMLPVSATPGDGESTPSTQLNVTLQD